MVLSKSMPDAKAPWYAHRTMSYSFVSRIENGLRFVADYELITFAKVLNVNIE